MLLIIAILFIVLLATIFFMIYRDEKSLLRRLLPRARIEEYWDGRERRRYARFKKMLEVTYTVERSREASANLKSAKTVDISEGGVKLLLGEKLAKGTLLNLEIELADSKKISAAKGEVVWSGGLREGDASGKRLFHSGIRFVSVSEPQNAEISNYIRSVSIEGP